MFDWNLSSTGCWQSGFSSQLWISRNEKTNLEFKKSGWSLPALHISHIPLAKRALWLSFITKIMIKIAQNSPVQHKNTRNSLVILFFYFWYWPKGLKGVEHERLWSYSKFRGAFQFEGFYQKSILLLNFAKKFKLKKLLAIKVRYVRTVDVPSAQTRTVSWPQDCLDRSYGRKLNGLRIDVNRTEVFFKVKFKHTVEARWKSVFIRCQMLSTLPNVYKRT